MKQQWSRILLGVLRILAGLGYAGDVMGFWHFDLFFAGWWSLFIIIPCVVSIVENGFDTGNSLGLVFGLMLLFSAQGILSWHRMIQLLFPALLIILGIGLLARPRQVPVPAGEVPPADLSHAPELSAVFSQETRRIANTITGGARLTAVFGSLTVDLRDAVIAQDIQLETTAVFGSVHLLLPENTLVYTKGVSLFGRTHNLMPSGLPENSPKIYLDSTNVFGSTHVQP